MEETCLQCGRADVDPEWLWLDVTRVDPEHDDDEQRIELLPFCGQAHAAEWLTVADLPWVPETGGDTTSGAWAGTVFLLIGLVAIVLSFVGAVAIALWIL